MCGLCGCVSEYMSIILITVCCVHERVSRGSPFVKERLCRDTAKTQESSSHCQTQIGLGTVCLDDTKKKENIEMSAVIMYD